MCRTTSVLISTICFLSLMLFLLLYVLGAARYVTDFEENTCDMTYMFEYPQYVRISLDDETERRYPRYGLYAYGEGFVTEKLRRMFFSGIPVLFIPGNVGSHEQVRSLASVSLRKSLNDRTPFHFDYFTVSLGKDYSALYGGVLMDETTYVSHCIRKILSLYKTMDVESVVLIGHSMGGIIAKGSLVMTPNVNASVASIIFTLATPHVPTLVLDRTFASYYHALEERLYAIKDAGTSVISIGGGPRDILITPTQTFDPTADINIISSAVPAVWKSTDHLSILWCKQLVFSVVRSLFDCVGGQARRRAKIFPKSEERIRALSYHLNHRASGKKFYSYKEKMQFELASSVEGQSRVCDWGWNLTNRTRIMPDPIGRRLRKTVDLDLGDLLKYSGVTHVVVRILPDSLEKDDHGPVTVNVDLYSYNARVIGPIGGGGGGGVRNLLKDLLTKPKVRRSDRGHVRYYVLFGEFMNTVKVELKASECTDPKHATVELQEPWSVGVSQMQFFTVADDGPKTIKVQTRPGRPDDVLPTLRLTLDPACSYSMDIREGGIVDRISCIVRDRWHLLYTTAVGLLLLILSTRITHGHEWTPILVITICLSFFYELTFECLVASAILCVFAIGLCCSVVFLGSLAHGIAVRFLARAIAFSTTWSDWLLGGLNQLPFVTALFVLSLIPATCGALAMIVSVFLHFLNLTRMYEDYLEELLMGSLQRRFKWMARFRTSMKNNNAEHHDDDDHDDQDTRQKIFHQLIFFILWCLTAVPAVPSVLVWARNFSYDMRLSNEDPLLLQSWILLVTYSTMGWVQIPSDNSKIRSQILSSILCFLGWVVLLMGATPRPSFCQYYVPPVVALAIGTVALNFVFS